jgi:WD40 repeat protein
MSFTQPVAVFPYLAGAAFLLLGATPAHAEDPPPARTDFHGDPLPAGAVARLGTVRLRHFDAYGLTFSTDGKRLCTHDNATRIWDVATGQHLERKPFPQKPDVATGEEVRRVSKSGLLSPDGKLVLSDKGLWDVETGKLRHKLEFGFIERFWDVAFTPDGKRLVGIAKHKDVEFYEDGQVRMWDTTTGMEIKGEVQGESMAISPDSKTLAVGRCRGDRVLLLDASSLKEKGSLPSDRIIKGLAFSPDGRFLAGAGGKMWGEYIGRPLHGNSVVLWDIREKKQPRRLVTGDVNGRFAFTPDSKMLACASSGGSEIFLWDTSTGRRLVHHSGHGRAVDALAVSSDGQFTASVARDGLYLWKTASGEALEKLSSRDDRSPVCLFSPDGKQLITSGPAGSVQVWEVSSGKELHRFKLRVNDEPVTVEAAVVSADGKRLSAIFSIGRIYGDRPSDRDGRLLVWDLTSGKELERRRYKLESHPVRGAAERRVVPQGPLPVALLRAEEFCTTFDPPPPEPWATVHAAFAPGGEVMSVWLGKQVGLVEVSSARRLAVLPQGVGRRLVFSPDGRLLACTWLKPLNRDDSRDEREPAGVALIEAATGEEILRVDLTPEFHDQRWAFAFTPDSRNLAIADSNGLRVWDTATGERVHRLIWPESLRQSKAEVTVKSLALLAGGRAITGMDDGQILVWDLAPESWTGARPVGELGREELDHLWSDLAADARKGQRALHTLAAVPKQSLPFLRERQRPVAVVDAERVEKLLADFDESNRAKREAAVRELTGLRDRIEPALLKRLRGNPTLETRRRLEALLAGPLVLSIETRRTMRVVAALEQIGTPEARRLLEKISSGADASETRAARAALARLKQRLEP